MGQLQHGWRSCPKCQGMYYAGFVPFEGVCPAGGQHSHAKSFAYSMTFDAQQDDKTQGGFASCKKCQGLFFAGFGQNQGVCPAGGAHDSTGSFSYAMLHDVGTPEGTQSEFRSCSKCRGLYFGPFPGVCPAGGAHDPDGSFNYAMHVQSNDPNSLSFDSGLLTVPGALPLDAFVQLLVRSDGSYHVFRHVHISGLDEIEYTLTGLLLMPTGEPSFRFEHQGSINPINDPDEVGVDGRDPRIAAHFDSMPGAKWIGGLGGKSVPEEFISDLIKKALAAAEDAAIKAAEQALVTLAF
ncbi:hypothetical protein [Paraburkholderia sp. RL17-337-BIB-A]|uniref:hypothetical protein n=1 Tax=Paraburkholderia sp. RL17-337-BIB-A TaxID=3031636 RepID=UPI0038BCBE31